ncbi:GIY-YIG nuclease family protein [Bradyrhizobium sp. CAR08]
MALPTVYFARAGHDGPIKIGYTASDPLDRVGDLQTGCPWRITLIGAVSGTTQDEARLHALFPHLRLEGEWFRPEPELIAAVDSLLAGTFEWPAEVAEPRVLPEQPDISDIIWAAGGPNRISAASGGRVTPDAIHKWRRNGIRDWHWALLMSLCDVSVEQFYKANLAAAQSAAELRVA